MARRLALLVGNGAFDNPETFSNSRTPVNDVADLGRVLREYGNFEVLDPLLDETSWVISETIEDIFSMAEQDDLVLLYYSGYGYQDRAGNHYLVAKNSQPHRMRTTSVPAFLIHNVMQSSHSQHRIIILDCCFGSALEDRKDEVNLFSLTEIKGEAEAILISSGQINYSFEEEGQDSLFTQYLVQGIETGEADQNKDGKITIKELFDYAEERVRSIRPGQIPIQEMTTHASEIVIAKNLKGLVAKPGDTRRDFKKGVTVELNFPNAVRDERELYGRRLERERIQHTLLVRSGRPVIILGERRIGKTSLQVVTARHLAAEESQHFVPLFLPPASAIRSLDDYAKEILQGICSYLGVSLGDTGLLDSDGRFQLSALGQFTHAAAQLLEEASRKTFIVCIDEFDAILVNCSPEEANQIQGLTDHLIERSGSSLVVYYSMTYPPESIRNSYRSPGISRAEVIELGPLSEEETVEMVRGLLKDQVRLGEGAMERLLRLSAGHPYFVKLLLDRLLARHWRGARLSVSPAMLEEVIPDAARDPRARHALDNIYKVHFNRQERQLVLLLAARESAVGEEELRALGPDFITAARRLERRGYLAREEEDKYDFRVHFLGRWLRDWEEYEEELEELNLERLSQKLDVDIEIDGTTRQVFVKGSPVKLTAQAYQALAFLCRHAGQLVSRDQLAQALWPEAKGAVSDAAIDAAIYRLRGKLGDDARQPRYIETVPDQGFILHRAAFVGEDPDSASRGGPK